MSALSKLGKNLLSSFYTKAWLCLLLASIVALCCIGFSTCSTHIKHDVPELDAAGLEEEVDNRTADNRINTAQLPDSSFIYEVTIEDLSNADVTIYEGQTVQVTGEVVGDRILAEGDPDHCWITLQSIGSDDSEIEVLLPTISSSLIDTYGAYGKRGTNLQIRGKFSLACKDHTGVTDLHCESVHLVSKGITEKAEFSALQLIPGIILIMIGAILLLVFDVMRERQK